MSGLLKGKTAIVTGAGGSIGFAITMLMAGNGADIFACGRHELSDEQLEKLDEVATSENVKIQPVIFDLQDEEARTDEIRKITQDNNIDILVCNAAQAHSGMLQTTSISKMREIFEINFFSQMHLIQLVTRSMIHKKIKGNIITLGSMGGVEPRNGYIAYGSSKAALIWATRSLALELKPFGIRANSIAPGFVNTKQLDINTAIDKEKLEKDDELASPLDIANVALFLASDKSKRINGEVIQVNRR